MGVSCFCTTLSRGTTLFVPIYYFKDVRIVKSLWKTELLSPCGAKGGHTTHYKRFKLPELRAPLLKCNQHLTFFKSPSRNWGSENKSDTLATAITNEDLCL